MIITKKPAQPKTLLFTVRGFNIQVSEGKKYYEGEENLKHINCSLLHGI